MEGCPAYPRSGPAGAPSSPRDDAREDTEFRPICMKLGVNPQASGSAYVEIGSTKVLCAIYGPRENPRVSGDLIESGTLECLVQYAPFATNQQRRPDRGGGGTVTDQEREISRQVEAALQGAVLLDRFPKSVIEVHIIVLEADGGELCAAVVAASLALTQANIDLVDLCVATMLIYNNNKGNSHNEEKEERRNSGSSSSSILSSAFRLQLDPTAAELASASATTTVCMLPQTRVLTFTSHTGEASPSHVLEGFRLAMDGCTTIYQQMRAVLVEEMIKRRRNVAV